MRILISGAGGYIGSKLVVHLRAADHAITAITRGATPSHALWLREVESLPWDMTRPFDGKPPIGFDLMIHAAGANDVDSADPREALVGTALTTRNAVAFCREAGIRRVIYLSTFQVFGRSEGEVSDESPVQCNNDYALTHWFAEEYLRTAQRNGQLDAVIVRPTNVYGAPLDRAIDRWTLVPACFCKDAVERQSIVLRSSGRQYRNFIHVDAVADAVAFVAGSFERAKGRSYILAGTEVATIRSIAEEAVAAYSKKLAKPCALVVESNQPAVAAPLQVRASALAGLGYQPRAVPTVADEIDTLLEMISSR